MISDGVKVDLVLTDPPYLMNYKTNRRKDKNHRFCKPILNDSDSDVIEESIKLYYDLLKDKSAMYMFCNDNHVDYFKQVIENKFKFKNILIWVKNNHTAGDLKGAYAKKTEFIIYAVKGRHILNGKRNNNVLFYDKVASKKQLHQNEKPVDLLEFLINKSSDEGDIVLDGFMGAGSTGVACNNLNRDFIGIELDTEYFNVAYDRLNNVGTDK